MRDRPRSAQECDRQSVPLRPWRTTHDGRAGRYHNTDLTARPMSPRDKNQGRKVGAYRSPEQWLLARIRNETFTSLGDLNRRLFELTESSTRDRCARTRQAGESCSRAAREAQRSGPFLLSHFKPRAGRKSGSISTTTSTSIITSTQRHAALLRRSFGSSNGELARDFHLGARVACHVRSCVRGGRTTTPEHMPSTHRAHAEWTPSHPRFGQRPWVKTHALSWRCDLA